MRGSGWSSAALGPEGSGLGSVSIAMLTSRSVSSEGSAESIVWVEGGIDGFWVDNEWPWSAMMRLKDFFCRPRKGRQKAINQ